MWIPRFVVLDSNVFTQNIALTDPSTEVLRYHCRHHDTTIIVPEVVRQEMAGNISRKVRTAAKSGNTTTKLYREAGLPSPEYLRSIDKDELVVTAQRNFSQRLLWLGAETLPFPQVPHEDVVNRLHNRMKPFRDGEHKELGYRDYLIWHNVLSLDGSVAFVSSNSRDFANKSKDDLHPDLKEDLSDNGPDVRLFLSLSQFAGDILNPQFETLAPTYVENLPASDKRALETFASVQLEEQFIEACPDFSEDDVDTSWMESAAADVGLRPDLVQEDHSSRLVRVDIVEGRGGISLEADKLESFSCEVSVVIAEEITLWFWYGELESVWDSRVVELQAAVEFTVRREGDSIDPYAVSLQDILRREITG